MKLIHFFSIALIQPNKNHVLSNKTTTKKSGKTSPSSCNRNAKTESTKDVEADLSMTGQLVWLLTGHLQPLDFWRWKAAGGGPTRTPVSRLAARGGFVGDKNLLSKVFRPSECNGGVSFAIKWPQSRVSMVAALFLQEHP
ncbi:hypothetical protein MTR_1g054185 [Medicago truncatula]|uniref:Uncharacterized protein n=1 Tax=Medicago truncatula TaxID=3880 RepID=A0A072VIS2_MEDTR|nr:hypothetical protein MTR_1g054185 [Medicago truncatula]